MEKEVKDVQATQKPKAKAKLVSCAHGVGRRKTAIARVWLKKGTGKVIVNNRNVNEYFDTDITRLDALTPFNVCSSFANSYDVKVNLIGGGPCCQAGAMRLGLSRALVSLDPDIRAALKKHKLLTVDSRIKERKKYGQKGARAKFQFVKR
jgi:small subunit ribosomal protein S9